MINQSFNLNNNCEASSTSCSHVTPYKTALVCLKIDVVSQKLFILPSQLQVIVTVGSIDVHRKSYDICRNATIPDIIKVYMLSLGIPAECPITKSSVFCYKGEKQFKLSKASEKMLSMFMVTKTAKLKFTFKHDTGLTCFECDSGVSFDE